MDPSTIDPSLMAASSKLKDKKTGLVTAPMKALHTSYANMMASNSDDSAILGINGQTSASARTNSNSNTVDDEIEVTAGRAVPHATGSSGTPIKIEKTEGTPEKQPPKRTRTKSNATSSAGPSSATKCIRKNALTAAQVTPSKRRMPTFAGTDSDLLNSGDLDFMNFGTTVYEIRLGATDFKYHLHESALLKSPKMAAEVATAKARARKTQHQTIVLNPHNPVAFSQLLAFLYMGAFKLLPSTKADSRAKELHELMALARHYKLPALQKQVVTVAVKTSLLNRMKPMQFFEWAEDMWYEQLEHDKGSFKAYFDRVAPGLLRGSSKDVQEGVTTLLEFGGSYAKALFTASLTAMNLQRDLVAVKPEPGVIKQQPGSAEASATPGLFVEQGRTIL